jgi:hypothetical protein
MAVRVGNMILENQLDLEDKGMKSKDENAEAVKRQTEQYLALLDAQNQTIKNYGRINEAEAEVSTGIVDRAKDFVSEAQKLLKTRQDFFSKTKSELGKETNELLFDIIPSTKQLTEIEDVYSQLFGFLQTQLSAGSTQVLDETGKAYTEYLMRCQYGTTWDNLQPWIVARRYREFDQLDLQLRKYYPTLAKSLIKLPEKDYFRFLEADVVEKRRLALEDYMYTVVVKLPSILRSDLFNEFLGIHERIYTIRTKLGGFVYDASAGNNSNTLPLSNDELDGILSDISLVLTYDKAESIREATNCQSFDEDGLGRLEEDVRDLCNMLKRATVHDLSSNSKFRNLFTSCSQRWPRLRATTVVGASDLDFTLIPRAMQTEEDLIRAIDEFKSLVEAGKMLSTV